MTETRPVRQGEEVDIERLRVFLEGELGTHAQVEIEQFPGGSSNLTYLIRLTQPDHVEKSGSTEYVLRRPPFGNTVKTAHDMRREFDVLSKLSAVYQPAPKPLLFCGDDAVIGSEFYLMERRHGLIIRGKIPETQDGHPELQKPARSKGSDSPDPHGAQGTRVEGRALTPSGLTDPGTQAESVPHASADGAIKPHDLETSQEARRDVCRSFIAGLVQLHTLDHKTAGLGDLGRIEGYNRRQVEGWTKRYFAAKTHDWDSLERSIEWLNANIPAESGASLVHNDYKFDNVMLAPSDLGRITAVLDWEMVTVGDPLMDLGTTLGYWMSADAGQEMLSMPFNPRVLMENIPRQELVELYEKSLGRTLPDMLFYYVFGTFKIAVIAQQIYARYVKGFTKDERFARFHTFVAALGRIAANAIDAGKI